MNQTKPKITCTEYVQLTYENFCKDKRAVRSGVIEIEYENLSTDEKASLLAHIAHITESIEAGTL